MTSTPRRLDRRPARGVPVTIFALALLVVGGLAAWLLGALLIDGAWPSSAQSSIDQVGALRLDAPAMIAVSVVLGVAGLVMLGAALIPGRSSRSRVLDGEIPGQTAVSHRDLARRVRVRVERADGVHSARVQVTPRRVRVIARTVVDDPEAVRPGIQAAADQAVEDLRPAAALRTTVRLHHND